MRDVLPRRVPHPSTATSRAARGSFPATTAAYGVPPERGGHVRAARLRRLLRPIHARAWPGMQQVRRGTVLPPAAAERHRRHRSPLDTPPPPWRGLGHSRLM